MPDWPPQPDRFLIYAEAGAYRSHGSDFLSPLRWNRDRLEYPVSLPATVLLAYTGQPVTDLIENPMLSSEMKIVDAKPDFYGEQHYALVTIEQPRLLFCSGSGRTWHGEAAS